MRVASKIVSCRPLLVRPHTAVEVLGSPELLDQLVRLGWVKPVIQRNRLTLYSLAHLESAVTRLELGEALDARLMSSSTGSKCA